MRNIFKTLINLFLIVLLSNKSNSSSENDCNCNINDLWLDVAIIIDDSKMMGADGKSQVLANVASLFGQTRIGFNNTNDPRYNRLSIINYNKVADIVVNLDYWANNSAFEEFLPSFVKTTNVSDSIIVRGLAAAENVLIHNNTNQKRAQKVAILYTSVYKSDGVNDPLAMSQRFKQFGITLITVGFKRSSNEYYLKELGKLASPNCSFLNTDKDLVEKIQKVLCNANCHCPSGWHQMIKTDNSIDGICLLISSIESSWSMSKLACQRMDHTANLVFINTQWKNQYVKEILLNKTKLETSFHIGLRWDFQKLAYFWEQPTNRKPIAADSFDLWAPGFPNIADDKYCVSNYFESNKTGWANIGCDSDGKLYICQMDACDTSRYCRDKS